MEEHEARRPALGPTFESRHVSGRERLFVDVAEQPLDLPGSKSEIIGIDLEKRTGDELSGPVQVRTRARGDQDSEPRGPPCEETLECSLGRGAAQGMEIVDHEEGRLLQCSAERVHGVLDVSPAAPEAGYHGGERLLEGADERGFLAVSRLGHQMRGGRAGGGEIARAASSFPSRPAR